MRQEPRVLGGEGGGGEHRGHTIGLGRRGIEVDDDLFFLSREIRWTRGAGGARLGRRIGKQTNEKRSGPAARKETPQDRLPAADRGTLRLSKLPPDARAL